MIGLLNTVVRMGAARLLTFLFHGLLAVSLILNAVAFFGGEIRVSSTTSLFSSPCPKP